MALPTISALSSIPSLSDDPESFTEEADRFFNGLPLYRTEMNTLAAAIDVVAGQIDSAAEQVTDAVNDAVDAKTAAESASAAAFASANLTTYNNGSTYSPPDQVLGSNGVVYRAVQSVPAGDNPVTSTTGRWIKAMSVDQVAGVSEAGKALMTAASVAAQQAYLGISTSSGGDSSSTALYDANGRVFLIETTPVSGNVTRIGYSYNSDGSVSTSVESEEISGVFQETRRTTYTYSNGQLSSWTIS